MTALQLCYNNFLDIGLFQGLSIKFRVGYCGIWAAVAVWYGRLLLHFSVYLFLCLHPLSFCLYVCMSVRVHECVVMIEIVSKIIYYDTFKFDSKNQFKVSQLQIYTIQNYKTTDLKIILTVRPFMQSHKNRICIAQLSSLERSSSFQF